MKDLVIAVYRRDCYAGETILRLEKVLYDEEIPEEYNTSEFEIKPMYLVEWQYADVINEYVNRLKEHYPHSPTVINTVEKVANKMLDETEHTDNKRG